MTFQLSGLLAKQDRPSPGEHCPIARTLGVIGTKSAMLILREAFYGTTRFDDFTTRAGITPAATAARLRELVEAGILTRVPYREEGKRAREGYALTDSGRELAPVIIALAEWGSRHLPAQWTPEYSHAECGAALSVQFRCAEGHALSSDEVEVHA